MPNMTLTTLQTNAESILDELIGATPQFRLWTAAELTVWLNEAQRDIARRAEVLQKLDTTISAVVGTAKYTLPTDIIRLHRVEYVPTGSTQTYPISFLPYEQMDQVWGYTQTNQSSYPSYYTLWGQPGALTIQFFPVPSQTGNFNLFYYRLPVAMVSGSDTADIPAGWEDLLYTYCEFKARRKNRDPLWKEVKAEYESSLDNLINVTRQYAEDAQQFINGNNLPGPYWLNGWGEF